MYCRECGKQIADKSKFCSYCGNEQSLPEVSIVSELDVLKETSIKKLQSTGIKIPKEIIGYYLAWFALHLIFLLVAWNYESGKSNFWPFNGFSELRNYDFSEFLVYTLIPVFVFVLHFIFEDKTKIVEINAKYDLEYKWSDTSKILVFIFLALNVIFYNVVGGMEDMNEEEIVSVVFGAIVLRSFTAGFVQSVAKELNRDKRAWVLFGFLMPLITLLVLVPQKKIKIEANENQVSEGLDTSQTKFDSNQKARIDNSLLLLFMILLNIGFYLIAGSLQNLDTSIQDGLLVILTAAFLLRSGTSLVVNNIAKELNRDKRAWALFGFLMPLIALFVLAPQKKIKLEANENQVSEGLDDEKPM